VNERSSPADDTEGLVRGFKLRGGVYSRNEVVNQLAACVVHTVRVRKNEYAQTQALIRGQESIPNETDYATSCSPGEDASPGLIQQNLSQQENECPGRWETSNPVAVGGWAGVMPLAQQHLHDPNMARAFNPLVQPTTGVRATP